MKISTVITHCCLILLIGIGIVNTSCENVIGPVIIKPPTPDLVSYSLEIQPIFDISCSGCHDEFHQFLDLRPCCSNDQLWTLGTNAPYVDTNNPGQSKLYLHLTGELLLMPLFGALPEHEIDLVLQWISVSVKNGLFNRT